MPAVISVEGGADDGRSFQIEEDVVRVGRTPLCQIVLTDPAVPETALVVRYQGGGYFVYNRTAARVTVGGVPVGPNQHLPWPPNQAVAAWPGATLILTVSGDPAPAPRRLGLPEVALGTDDVPEGPVAVAPPPAAAGHRAWQYVVIGLTWVAVGGVVAYKALGPESVAPETASEFDGVVAALRAGAGRADPLAAEVADALREARTAELRGHAPAARRLYGGVVVRLQTRPAAPPAAGEPDPLARALAFARSRASSLGAED